MDEHTVTVTKQHEDVQYLNDEEFDQELSDIYEVFQRLNQRMIPELDTRLKHLMKLGKENMDIRSYMLIIYLEGVKYKQEENKNATCFCAMRLLWMKECQKNLRKKRSRYLDMQPFDTPVEMDVFIDEITSFLNDVYTNMNRKLRILTLFLFLIVFGILVFVLHVSFLFGAIEALLIGSLNYIVQKRRLPDMFQKNQTNAVERFVEEEVLTFDRPYRI